MKQIFVLLIMITVTGCSLWGGSKTPKADLKTLKVVAAADANQDTPTALDVVFVYDATVEQLLPTTAIDWFSKKQVLQGSMGSRIDVVSLQIPPAKIIDEVPLPSKHSKAVYVVIYANYIAKKGQFPINLTGFTNALVKMKSKSISYQELKD